MLTLQTAAPVEQPARLWRSALSGSLRVEHQVAPNFLAALWLAAREALAVTEAVELVLALALVE